MMLRTTRTTATMLGLGLLATSGCANRSAETIEGRGTARPPIAVAAAPTTELAASRVESIALVRSLHEADMSEVVLDPRGEAALTLDTEGGVRLWTALRAGHADAPLSLPVQDPAWISLAQAADGAFVVGFIDTAGGARVARVELEGARARMVSSFEIPITDPLLELHVLDGGRRVLALGVDHRVRLYDAEGELVSAVDQPGFVPWQLRVSEVPGQAPVIVAVLAGPTRVQPIALDDDRLELRGEPRMIDLDQGPNRNDLALSPDGSTVVALRRPRTKGQRFTIELVDLATDERRVVAGEVDGRIRPRMHVVDEQRVLLESGTGKGFWVELSAAVPWTAGTGRKQTEALALTPVQEVSLPGSAEQERLHTTVVAGMRAVPTAHALVLDTLDEAGHVELVASPVRPRAVALDATGVRAAWSTGNTILLDETDGGGTLRELPAGTAGDPAVVELAFVGDDQLLAVSYDGHASLLRCSDGQPLASARLPASWGVAATSFRPHANGEGTLAVLGNRPQDPLEVVDVHGTGFGDGRQEPRSNRAHWSALGVRSRDLGGVLDTLHFDAVDANQVDSISLDSDGSAWLAAQGPQPLLYRVADGVVTPVPLRQGQVRRLVPDPTGARLAVVQLVHHAREMEGSARADRFAVTVLDARTHERAWTRASVQLEDLDWSADGKRLAVGDREGGAVIDATTGELVYVRRHRGLQVNEVAAGE